MEYLTTEELEEFTNEVIHDYEWYINEGKDLSQDYVKCVCPIKNKQKIKEAIRQCFREEDLKRFYIISNAIWNQAEYIAFYKEYGKDYILDRYIKNKRNLEPFIIGNNLINHILSVSNNIYTFHALVDRFELINNLS